MPLQVRDVPVGTTVEPHTQVEGGHERGDGSDHVLGDDALFDDGHVPVDEQAPVEGGDGRLQIEWLDEHGHSSRRTPARDGEEDSGITQAMHGGNRLVGEDLVLGHEGSVHVRQHQANGRRGHDTSSVCPRAAAS
jgi:hypothetical protein